MFHAHRFHVLRMVEHVCGPLEASADAAVHVAALEMIGEGVGAALAGQERQAHQGECQVGARSSCLSPL